MQVVSKRKSLWVLGLSLIGVLILTVIIAASVGSAHIPILTAFKILTSKIPVVGQLLVTPDWNQTAADIVLKIRLPRVLLGVVVGASLSVSGAAFQGLFRNPLADPYTVGVSSGASVGAVLVMVLGLGSSILGEALLPIAAFAGGMLTLMLVYQLAQIGGRIAVETLVLAGVVAGAFMSAIVSFLIAMADKDLHQVIFWLMGSLALRGWQHLVFLLPLQIAGILTIWACAKDLNLLSLGEDTAAQMGVDVERTKIILLVAAALVTGIAVALSGTIAFVGLIIPHLVRLTIGPDHRVLIPMSALVGAIYLVGADTIARTVIAPEELPVGVITAVLGAPFFAYLLRARRVSGRMGGSKL